MDARQHLFYATGILAYGIAKADGKIQLAEKEKLQEIVGQAIEHDIDANYMEIIFELLEHDKVGFEGVYKWAMDAFETGKHHLTDSLRARIVAAIKEVANAFNKIDKEEQQLLDQFESDLAKIKVNHTIS